MPMIYLIGSFTITIGTSLAETGVKPAAGNGGRDTLLPLKKVRSAKKLRTGTRHTRSESLRLDRLVRVRPQPVLY
jgi:hypothetical protein